LDPDRHNASECPIKHQNICNAVYDFAAQQEEFYISGEVNPENGSAKIVMWHKIYQNIPIEMATKYALEFKAKILAITGENIEVFPRMSDV